VCLDSPVDPKRILLDTAQVALDLGVELGDRLEQRDRPRALTQATRWLLPRKPEGSPGIAPRTRVRRFPWAKKSEAVKT
jgi:hypothetical protein